MRTIRTILFAILLSSVCTRADQTTLLKPGDRIAIVGDSITESKLYSKFIELYLLACTPQLGVTVHQFGWNGDAVSRFVNRMDNDLFPWKPTVVTTCFGMNDGRYRPYTEEIGAAYEEGTRRLQERCKELGIRMVVGGPGAVDTDFWKPQQPDADQFYNKNLATLSAIAGKHAAANGFAFANLHPLMMETMSRAKAALGKDYPVCGGDGVHPNANGHLIMACAFLKAMGLDGHIGTLTVDWNGESSASDGHRIISSNNGTLEIESTRYPFCFEGDETSPHGTRSILPFLSFNQDLNRFMLVIRNLPSAHADITWGEETKTFSREELEEGINLAGHFVESPFTAAFKNLDQLVSAKQAFETFAVKGVITGFRTLQNEFPDDEEISSTTRSLRGKLYARQADRAAAVRAAVTPVRHTLHIKPK